MNEAKTKIVIFAIAMLLLTAPAAGRADPVKIRIAYVVPIINLASILPVKSGIAVHDGKSYILDVIRYQASTTQITRLANGELDIASRALALCVVLSDLIHKNPNALTDFLEDYLRAVRFYTDPANQMEASSIA